jgi:hypothetical protein
MLTSIIYIYLIKNATTLFDKKNWIINKLVSSG